MRTFSRSILLAVAGLATLALLSYGSASAQQSSTSIIADHKAAAEFDRIPPKWLDAAKNLTLYYGGASHGTQPLYGAGDVERSNPAYKILVGRWELPAAEITPAFRINFYSMGPEGYWSTREGLATTRAAAKTGLYNHSMFSWCGEMGGLSKESVQQYLETLNRLEAEFPGMRFIYMTGHAEYQDRWTRSELERNNRIVREYAISHNKVLFDFYDLDTHDPSGKYHSDATDSCTWCSSWCKKHPADCTDLGGSQWPGECAHSHPLNCKMKAKAFWWMMARLAGWDGNTATTPPPAPSAR